MVKNYVHIVIRPETIQLVDKCTEMWRNNYPSELDGSISRDKIIKMLARYYISNQV